MAEDEAQGLINQVFLFAFLLLDLSDYSLTVLWLTLTFLTDLSLLFSWPALVASGQPFT